MFLVDSNIIIYSFFLEHAYLRSLIVTDGTYVSEISRVEVLDYHKLSPKEEIYFRKLFSLVPIIAPSQVIFDTAIEIRKKHNSNLGDSIIGATALSHGLSIYSRNLKDFEKINNIICVNPVL